MAQYQSMLYLSNSANIHFIIIYIVSKFQNDNIIQNRMAITKLNVLILFFKIQINTNTTILFISYLKYSQKVMNKLIPYSTKSNFKRLQFRRLNVSKQSRLATLSRVRMSKNRKLSHQKYGLLNKTLIVFNNIVRISFVNLVQEYIRVSIINQN